MKLWQVHIALGFTEEYYTKYRNFLKNAQKAITIGFGRDFVFAVKINT